MSTLKPETLKAIETDAQNYFEGVRELDYRDDISSCEHDYKEGAKHYALRLQQVEQENERLRKALKTYVSWNIEESQRMGYYKNHLASPLYLQGQEALKQTP